MKRMIDKPVSYDGSNLRDVDNNVIEVGSKKDLCLINVYLSATNELEVTNYYLGSFYAALEADGEGQYSYTVDDLTTRIGRCPLTVYYDFSEGGEDGPWTGTGILQYIVKAEQFQVTDDNTDYVVDAATMIISVYGPEQY